MRLSVKGLGLTLGILWAFIVLFICLMTKFGYYANVYNLLNEFYLGLITLTPVGMLISVVIGFVDAFIFGIILAWVYNRFVS
ncbi:MAG: hypothetical protein ABIE74_10355 [Pseudomonadota bacterium]